MDKIELTEEQARELATKEKTVKKKVCIHPPCNSTRSFHYEEREFIKKEVDLNLIEEWKQKGYIKKDPVEEAEEIILKHIQLCNVGTEYYIDFFIIKDAIIYLKQQLKDKEDE